MRRLFLTVAILALAGASGAQEFKVGSSDNGIQIAPNVWCYGTPETCATMPIVTEMAPFVGYYDGAYHWNKSGTTNLTIKGASQAVTINGGMVTIHPDGTIEYGKDYTPDAAAKAFWDAIGLERKNRADK